MSEYRAFSIDEGKNGIAKVSADFGPHSNYTLGQQGLPFELRRIDINERDSYEFVPVITNPAAREAFREHQEKLIDELLFKQIPFDREETYLGFDDGLRNIYLDALSYKLRQEGQIVARYNLLEGSVSYVTSDTGNIPAILVLRNRSGKVLDEAINSLDNEKTRDFLIKREGHHQYFVGRINLLHELRIKPLMISPVPARATFEGEQLIAMINFLNVYTVESINHGSPLDD